MFGASKDFIRLKIPKIRRKYIVNVIGDMTMGGFNNKTNAQTEWTLSIRDIYNDNSVLLELLTYDTEIIESKNNAFKELAIVGNQFKKATREVVCVISKEGNLLKLINIDYIKERWNNIKNEMITFLGQTKDMEDFFKIDNEKFARDEVLTEFVNQLEFFKVYFNGLYGTYLPPSDWRKSENLFKSNKLEYQVKYDISEEFAGNYSRVKFSSCDFNINKKWIEKAYGNFQHLVDLEYCQPKFEINGNYCFDNRTGLINDATFSWDEFVSSTLHVKTEYRIKALKD